MPRAACRLFVILAKEASRAVILRRGPSAWYHVILWHTDTDVFEHGAWFRGRIYEERCDLSPDGELFLYFALQGRKWCTDYMGSWTALSRPPWLHALTLWPQGDTWGGGGRFMANRKVAVANGGTPAHPEHPVVGIEVASPGIRVSGGRIWGGPAWGVVVEKPNPVPEAEWSGRDHRGRIIYLNAGRLFRRRGRTDALLADFNGLKPDPQDAPAWAKKPLAKRRRR